jgi:hypothetical protein
MTLLEMVKAGMTPAEVQKHTELHVFATVAVAVVPNEGNEKPVMRSDSPYTGTPNAVVVRGGAHGVEHHYVDSQGFHHYWWIG